jgi:hypothetical protein
MGNSITPEADTSTRTLCAPEMESLEGLGSSLEGHAV